MESGVREMGGCKMKRKVAAMLLAVSMAALSVTGCGSKAEDVSLDSAKQAETTSQTDTESQKESSSSGGVGGKLVIWEHTAQFEPALKAVIEGFQKQYPDVEIEYQIKTSDQYYNLLATSIQAGEAPDLFWTNGTATTNLEAYVAQGVIMDVTEVLDLSIFDDTAKKLITIDNKIWAAPTAEVGGRAVFYNKDIFEELNLSVPKTFSEFEAMLPVIKDAGKVPISFSGSDPWSVLFQFEPILAAMHPEYLKEYISGKPVTVNDKRIVEVYEKMLEWGKAGYYGPGFTGVDGAGALLAFSKGEAAMSIDGTWNTQTIQQNNPELNLGAFQLPCEDGTRPFVGTSSVGFSISQSTENKEAAIAFLNYFASLEGQTAWTAALDAIPCVEGIVSENPVLNEIADYDELAESYYTILGSMAAEGENPCKAWEEDQTKVLSGGIGVQEFVDMLASMTTAK